MVRAATVTVQRINHCAAILAVGAVGIDYSDTILNWHTITLTQY